MNDLPESDVGAAEGEAPEFGTSEDTTTTTEGKHHAYLPYFFGYVFTLVYR